MKTTIMLVLQPIGKTKNISQSHKNKNLNYCAYSSPLFGGFNIAILQIYN
ncbi:hypothetical protein BBUCA112A_P0031 (plasmid) [Borreliella burgdorferi CA-11.2A]|nr:hypothetical protein BBUCA112A_P0031 [Borreliella burgdorferi CA-11.2A]